jgi:hypothetical protein
VLGLCSDKDISPIPIKKEYWRAIMKGVEIDTLIFNIKLINSES